MEQIRSLGISPHTHPSLSPNTHAQSKSSEAHFLRYLVLVQSNPMQAHLKH